MAHCFREQVGVVVNLLLPVVVGHLDQVDGGVVVGAGDAGPALVKVLVDAGHQEPVHAPAPPAAAAQPHRHHYQHRHKDAERGFEIPEAVV
eukprot:CAMPEP_0118947670 /NCGR_PEP_ID=MMETSP1169-20130426/46462_1 /TAXON_ID=36882 /ORGANISM="Pyramimonas obovata, Strain CCMP722" /LENGTH=90 /DNA_ID=CAMNT_0006893929 /DNA_START=211 /DNA_END=480 /DNA_ORIENTATION=-